MSVTTTTAPRRRSNSMFVALTRVFNRVVLRLAGTRWLPLYGVLEHRGRRSGTLFYTPVVVRPAPDGFVVPMPWGETTDWYRNVRAAGGCRVRWKDHVYVTGEPRVMELSAASATFSSFQRSMMQRFKIQKVLHLRRTP
jgi:deazaflavin-dependent oxidoreductase (nitroreductase family)